MTTRRLAGQNVNVIATNISQNAKLGPVAVTTATLASCGPCPLRDAGCYAQQGPLGWMVKRMNDHATATAATPVEIARDEAQAIGTLKSGLPLRLHVAGDCQTDEAASIVSQAAERYSRRHRAPAWTYTHAWRQVSRSSWGQVSVLASCETPEHVDQAREAGYAAALVVEAYPNGRKSWKLANGSTAIPCPQTTDAAASCADCRLCWNDQALRGRNAVIAFEAHGAQSKKVKATLNVLNG